MTGSGFDEDHVQWGPAVRPGRLNAYQLSKALAEQAAFGWRRAISSSQPATGGIYGVRQQLHAGLPRHDVAEADAVSRVFPIAARVRGDVEALALALEKPISIGRAYNITGEDRSAWTSRAWRQAGGRSPWLMLPVPFPYRRVRHGAALGEPGCARGRIWTGCARPWHRNARSRAL
jgi:nucleoside-diphosphate-sugar epimerase